MGSHAGHNVVWLTSACGYYRLYCYTCSGYTRHETQTPNKLTVQRFETAFDRPKEKQDERQPA